MVLTPILVLVLAVQNPTLARSSVPYFALTSGLVVTAVARMCEVRRRTATILLVGTVALTTVGLAHLAEYRKPSPVVRALEHVDALGSAGEAAVVADPALVSFVELWRLSGRLEAEVHWVADPSAWSAMAEGARRIVVVYDAASRDLPVHGLEEQSFSCSDPWLCAVASPRYLDVGVVCSEGRSSRKR